MKTNREKISRHSGIAAPSNRKFKHSKECLQNPNPNTMPLKSIDTAESIARYYGFLGNSLNDKTGIDLNSCFAVRSASLVIGLISNGDFLLTKRGCLKKNFYNLCLQKAVETRLMAKTDDRDLFIIYFKQCVQLLRTSGILKKSLGTAVIDENKASMKGLYVKLLRAFWADAKWEELFPSDVNAAKDLKYNKSILKDLLLKTIGKTRLDAISNEFFDMTGFSFRNDLIMISFLDFYFFTWLRHFNLILYTDDSPYSPVCVTVTDPGRKILNSIL